MARTPTHKEAKKAETDAYLARVKSALDEAHIEATPRDSSHSADRLRDFKITLRAALQRRFGVDVACTA
jgi:hypothetical protein